MSVNNVTRQIVSHHRTASQITMVLADCGHQLYRKLSQGLPKTNRVRCTACTGLANGGQARSQNPDDSWTIWGWDYETNLPTRRTAPAKEETQ